jgi:mono/diheme cytochrome c family protein
VRQYALALDLEPPLSPWHCAQVSTKGRQLLRTPWWWLLLVLGLGLMGLVLARRPVLNLACSPAGVSVDFWRLNRLLDASARAPQKTFLQVLPASFPFRTGSLSVLAANRVTSHAGDGSVPGYDELLVQLEVIHGLSSNWELLHLTKHNGVDWGPAGWTHSTDYQTYDDSPAPRDIAEFLVRSHWSQNLNTFCEPVLAATVSEELQAYHDRQPLPCYPAIEKCPEVVQKGKLLFATYGCAGCHSGRTANSLGGLLNGIFGTESILEDGTKILVDDDYIRESILDPQAKVRAGTRSWMPSFKGQFGDDKLIALVHYIKWMGAEPASAAEPPQP